jgi:trimethylamine--corrinoid protein Co-methyltransferase
LSKPTQRQGVLVGRPVRRLSEDQVRLIDGTSRDLLQDPGLLCYNREAADLFEKAGAQVEAGDDFAHVRVPPEMVDRAVESAPSTITLGARNPENRLILDATEPRARFVSGSETNVWLDVSYDGAGPPTLTREAGSIERLCRSAHLCDHLEHLDAFIRNVNIQDESVTDANKDVNKFLASLNNITKHVQAGLTTLEALDDVIRLGQIVAGGEEAFAAEPVLSFIACVIKSPLQVVDDTAAKVIAVARRGVPIVISSCPMAGATAPFDEFGMVAQINAELLAGVTLTQLAREGAPVLYGSVPVRTRLDNLNDMYGAPEFNHYNIDCAQMARFYRLPCYSTSGVGDASEPGIQATAEKMLTYMSVPFAGPQYIHYAFGLLERTNVFCPEQAVLDNAHIGMVKFAMAGPDGVIEERRDEILGTAREIMATDHKTYIYHLPMPTREAVYVAYPMESDDGGALRAAHEACHEILARPRNPLPDEVRDDIRTHVPGVLDAALAGAPASKETS